MQFWSRLPQLFLPLDNLDDWTLTNFAEMSPHQNWHNFDIPLTRRESFLRNHILIHQNECIFFSPYAHVIHKIGCLLLEYICIVRDLSKVVSQSKQKTFDLTNKTVFAYFMHNETAFVPISGSRKCHVLGTTRTSRSRAFLRDLYRGWNTAEYAYSSATLLPLPPSPSYIPQLTLSLANRLSLDRLCLFFVLFSFRVFSPFFALKTN